MEGMTSTGERKASVDTVRDFYDRFNYPFSEVKDTTNLNGAAYLKILEFECRTRGYAGMRFLDVGCGSGHRILELAKAYPKAEFTAFDISEKSIEIAKAQASKDGVENIRFQTADLHEFLPETKFDVITVIGVLHHLPCPETGLKALRSHLQDTGVLVAWLYHSFGEHDKTLRREALRMLFDDVDSAETAMLLTRELGGTVDPERYGKSYGENLTSGDHDSKDADAYLSPIVDTYTFEQALKICGAAGFNWAAIDQINAQKSGYFLDMLQDSRRAMYTFKVGEILRGDLSQNRFYQASILTRLRILERLVLPTGFTMVAGSGPCWADGSKRLAGNQLTFPMTSAAGD